MKPTDIRKMLPESMFTKRAEFARELFNLKFQLHTGRLENTSKLKTIRKDIARINTILNEDKSQGSTD